MIDSPNRRTSYADSLSVHYARSDGTQHSKLRAEQEGYISIAGTRAFDVDTVHGSGIRTREKSEATTSATYLKALVEGNWRVEVVV